jgi:sugar phosphate isomerase/epimerase
MTRRDFIATSAAAPLAAAPAGKRPELCIFSKHMAQFNWVELGKKAKEMGFDGVDLTVRPKGHVEPARVAEDLPKAVAAVRAAGLTVPMITTDLKSAADPAARPTLAGAAKLKIPSYKVGYWNYRPGFDLKQVLADARANVESLLPLNREFGVAAGLHNHSAAYVGCSVWDYHEIMRGLDPKLIGYYFDPGHSFIEGGAHGWRVSLELALQNMKMAAVKDFYWEKQNGKWRVKWCPLGEGMVDWATVFGRMAKVGYSGPISLHVEYNPKDELEAIAKDFAYMKAQVAKAWSA